MSINNNFYYSAYYSIPENGNSSTYQNNVNYQNYSTKYEENGWITRKVIALPVALWSATVKPVYHLAKAIFFGLPSALFGNEKYFEKQVKYIALDFLEVVGRIISIFNDRLGLYYIHKSQFQKWHFDNMPASSSTSTNPPFVPPTFVPPTFVPPQKVKFDKEAFQAIEDVNQQYKFLNDHLLINGHFKDAYEAIQSLPYADSKKRGLLSEWLATACLETGNREQAYEFISDTFVDHKVRGDFAAKLANDYYNEGDREKAYKYIEDTFVDHKVRGDFAVKLANDYYAMGDREKAYKYIEDVFVNHKVRGDFAVKLANDYYNEGDREKAYKYIEDVFVDHKVRGDFAVKLATDYYAMGNREKAYKYMTDAFVDNKLRGIFAAKLAEEFYSEGDYLKGYQYIMDYTVNENAQEAFIIKTLKTLNSIGKSQVAVEIITDVLNQKIISHCYQSNLIKIAAWKDFCFPLKSRQAHQIKKSMLMQFASNNYIALLNAPEGKLFERVQNIIFSKPFNDSLFTNFGLSF